jgi:hypothetical protein
MYIRRRSTMRSPAIVGCSIRRSKPATLCSLVTRRAAVSLSARSYGLAI